MLEGRHIDIDDGGVQGKRLPFDEQRWGRDPAEGLPQDDERVTETITRALVTPLPPEKGGQLVASVSLTGPQPEIGQERLRLLGRQAHGGARGEPSVEASEQRQPEGNHYPDLRQSL
jgi:hypothetical protein